MATSGDGRTADRSPGESADPTLDPSSDRDTMRAADHDRQRVAERLHGALGEGRLSLQEYDERVRAAYAARTYTDLDGLLTDLPAARPGTLAVPANQRPVPQAPVPRHRRIPLALMILWTVWAGVAGINVAVWLLVVATMDGPVFPWPLFVALPPGVALLAATVGVQAIRRQRARDHETG
jgi:hypothetical protein